MSFNSDREAGMSFSSINPSFDVVALSGGVVLIRTVECWELEDRVAEQMGCSCSEARMALGNWLEFTIANYPYLAEDS
jgi:hypothetical protein